MTAPLVGLVVGSSTDWKFMRHAVAVLKDFGVPHEARIVSVHRTPDLLYKYAEAAPGRGLHCIIAGAGGAAPAESLERLARTRPVRPGAPAVAIAQDRIREKRLIEECGLAGVPYSVVRDRGELSGALIRLGGSAVL